MIIINDHVVKEAKEDIFCDPHRVFTKVTFGISRKSKFYTKMVLISRNFESPRPQGEPPRLQGEAPWLQDKPTRVQGEPP
jgi:hypothetical protein